MGSPGAEIGERNFNRVLSWFYSHPGGKQVECAEALELSVEAVNRHVAKMRSLWEGREVATLPLCIDLSQCREDVQAHVKTATEQAIWEQAKEAAAKVAGDALREQARDVTAALVEGEIRALPFPTDAMHGSSRNG